VNGALAPLVTRRARLPRSAVLASSCTAPLVLTMPLASSLSADVSRALSVTAVVSVAPNCLTGSVLRFRWSLTSPAWDPMTSPVVASAFNRSTSSVSLPANTCVPGVPCGCGCCTALAYPFGCLVFSRTFQSAPGHIHGVRAREPAKQHRGRVCDRHRRRDFRVVPATARD